MSSSAAAAPQPTPRGAPPHAAGRRRPAQPPRSTASSGVLVADDPTNEIGAAWGCKELLRQLFAARDPADIRGRLWAFYSACATANMAETSRLATTIETWWPHVLVFLELGVTNARTEGFNRIIKHVKRTGCGFRNMDNYQRRI